MERFKIKDLIEKLNRVKDIKNKNKLLYMWVKQDVISFEEFYEINKLIS